MKKMTLDSNNLPSAFYDTGIHKPKQIPKEAVKITEEQWREFVSNSGARRWNRSTKKVELYEPAFDLAKAKEIKRNEVRAAFKSVEDLPVTDHNGITWNGGFKSVTNLCSAKQVAELAGKNTVIFYDTDNVPHYMYTADAEAVILAVAEEYQSEFSRKQELMQAIDALPSTAGQDEIDNINFTSQLRKGDL